MKQLNPDLVILDIEMPEMDGLTALTHLRSSHPKTPVIMFSSLTELGAAATLEALSRGASDFFAKPGGAGRARSVAAGHSRRIDSGDSRSVRRQAGGTGCRGAKLRRRRRLPAPRVPTLASRYRSRSALRPAARMPWPRFLPLLPPSFPVPIVVVQHMPPMFTQMLAERLSKNSQDPDRRGEVGQRT